VSTSFLPEAVKNDLNTGLFDAIDGTMRRHRVPVGLQTSYVMTYLAAIIRNGIRDVLTHTSEPTHDEMQLRHMVAEFGRDIDALTAPVKPFTFNPITTAEEETTE
jgi:hypothetical protein